MKQPSRNIMVLAVILFLLASMLVVYALLVEKRARNIQPMPAGDFSTPLATPEPVVQGISIEEPFFREANIVEGDEYEIKGLNSPDVAGITLRITNAKSGLKIVPLDNFREGNTEWSFKFDASSDFLAEGKNTIVIIAARVGAIDSEEEITINVEKAPETINPGTIKVRWDKELVKLEDKDDNSDAVYYQAGVVAEGEYKGMPILLKTFDYGMGGPDMAHVIIKNGLKIVLEENNVKIEDLEQFVVPEKVVSPDGKYTLTTGNYANNFFKDAKATKILFKDDKAGNVYLAESGCAVIERPDHTAVFYSFSIPFAGFGVPEVTFIGEVKNKEEYNYHRIMGCGADCYYLDFADSSIDPDKRFKVAGITSGGDLVYEFIDPKDEELERLYNEENTQAYYEDGKTLDKSKYTYGEFLNLHPIFFWKDPLERWVRFENRKFETLVEMCKPVIYFYPEEKTKLNVQVSPNGGFTFSNPPYGTGWNIEAFPDGRIKDLRGGKEYGYLYWEGMGIDYPVKEEGWVVKKEELEKFFDEKLPLAGLNAKEVADFKEYWLDRLSEKPYYQLSFLTQNEFNGLAPIKFSPVEPKTLIRVMVTAKGLNEMKQISEQKLPETPVRNGFTVVEWGGTLLR